MNALIVDDSRAIRRILSGMLTDIGFSVAEASHGKEALAHLQTHASTDSRPDLVLVDWNMPEMNGLELVQAVRRAGAHKILFGSDGPWLHPGLELAKVEALRLAPAERALVLGGNLLRLIGEAPDRVETAAAHSTGGVKPAAARSHVSSAVPVP